MDDPFPQTPSQKQAPDYFNPHNVVQDERPPGNPLLRIEPKQPNPKEILKKKYPVRIIAGALVLIIMVLAVQAAVYLLQRPTRIFIEAEPTPSPSPTPTPTPTPLEADY